MTARSMLHRPVSLALIGALVLAAQFVGVTAAHACHNVTSTTPVPTADGFTVDVRWTTSNSGNTGISVANDGGASITWWLLDGYPDGNVVPGQQVPTSHAAGEAVRFVVSGLAPGSSATIVVQAYLGQSGDCSGANTFLSRRTITGTALVAAGEAPTFGDVARTDGGFTTSITNLDPDVTYTAVASTGTVTLVDGNITVTGLPAGASATVTVTASKAGHSDVSAQVEGTALSAIAAPTFGDVTRTEGGFTVPISNHDADATYTVSVSKGSVTLVGDVIHVTGLPASATAEVQVSVTKADHLSATSAVGGKALAAPVAKSDGSLPQLTPGEHGLLIDGQSGSLVRTIVDGRRVHLEGGGIALQLTPHAGDGVPLPLTRSGFLRVDTGQYARIEGHGFAPGSDLVVWVFSQPILLGEFEVAEDGTFGVDVVVPAGIAAGQHTLQVNGTGADGVLRSVTLGLLVDADEPAEVAPVDHDTQGGDPPSEDAADPVEEMRSEERLPDTGISVPVALALALSLLALGVWLRRSQQLQ